MPVVETHTNEYVLPKGRIYFDRFDDNGNPTGERYVGNTPGFTVSIDTQNLEHFSSESGIKEKDLDIVTQITRNSQVTVDDISDDNLALFFTGDLTSIVQSATPIVDEAINNVQQGRWYQLGETSGNPAGIRDVSAVTITDDVPNPAFTEGAGNDYLLDAELGRIYIIPGGNIANDTNLLCDYTPAAKTVTQMATATKQIKGKLRYVADNPQGKNRDLLAPSVTLKPTGDFSMKSEDDALTSMQFDVGFNKKDSNTAAVYINSRAA